MSMVNFTSGINKIERNRSLSEWAVEFIQLHSLSQNDYAKSSVFRSLSRREKDAVRYQMRKRNSSPKASSKKLARQTIAATHRPMVKQKKDLFKIGKILLSIWVSVFLLFDIVDIYILKGVSNVIAWQAAILVEICIVAASMSNRKELRRVAHALLLYNVLLFGFMEFESVSQRSSVSNLTNEEISQKNEHLSELKKLLNEQTMAASMSIKQLEKNHKRGYVTSGTQAFESVSQTISKNTSRLNGDIAKLEKELNELLVTKYSKLSIWTTSILYFFLRVLLQLFSIQLLKRREV